MAKVEEEIKWKRLLCWSGEHEIELFNSWDMSAEELKKKKKLASYWMRVKNFVKSRCSELIAVWELQNLRQGSISLEEFIAKLKILVKEANYPVEHNDRFMRDFLVLEMNSDRVGKDCFKVGNAVTFKEVRDIWRSQKSQQTNSFS